MQKIESPEFVEYYQDGKWHKVAQEDYETFQKDREKGKVPEKEQS